MPGEDIQTYRTEERIRKSDLNKKNDIPISKTIYWYFGCAILRVVLTCLPQNGYIHPDEYFQSIEVMAGHVFDVDHKLPWEFNQSQPIRSIVVPFITVGIPYKIMKLIDTNLIDYFQMSINNPYFLLVFPRIFITLLSFIVDICLYKICKINNQPFSQKLLLLSSSYVIFIYGTRTFSNTIEMVLFSVLLYLVADSQEFSRNVISQKEYLTDKYRKSRAAVDKARLYKIQRLLPSHSLKHCIAVSVIIVTGVFNRPTFMSFAIAPLFFWIHRGLGFKSVRFFEFHCRMFLFLACAIVTVFTHILIDSFYFGHISVAEVLEMDVTMQNFIVTPLNFIRYNMDVKNLAEHGLHPRFLHILVNVPILYNVLGIVSITVMATMLYRLLRGQYTRLPHIFSIHGLMIASIIAPVAALSYFPHQEPRFLIPITLPLIFLFGQYVIKRRWLYKFWITFNVICLVFYGFIHQGGIYPAVVQLSQNLQEMPRTHIVTSHVYTLPLSFLHQENPQKLYGTGNLKYKKAKSLFLQEMGSYSLPLLVKHLSIILQVTGSSNDQDRVLYLLIPTSKYSEISSLTGQNNITLKNRGTFYPHISTEAFPDLFSSFYNFYSDLSISKLLYNLFTQCGLGLYVINKST